MTGYTTREISRLLGLTAAQVRSFVKSGLVSPDRGPGRRFRFSFGDLIFLKAANDLLSARVGPRRIRRALVKLRKEFPDVRRLTGMQLALESGRLVVRDGVRRWNPDSGQTLLDFDVAELARRVAPIARRAYREAKAGSGGERPSAESWYEWGCELEAASPAEARDAYERALALDAEHADAHVNLGRLLHESGHPAEAEAHYRRALEARPDDATAAFNLGVALEDLKRNSEAITYYEMAAELEPSHADAHFNAANLWERLGDSASALRHLHSYRRLTRDLS